MKKLKLLPLPFLLAFFTISASSSFAQGDVEIQATVDNNPPTINLTSPNNEDTVSGIVNVSATAIDDGGITKVEFFVDGLLKQTDTTSPYTFSWDTGTVSNGSHTISAMATDIAGKTDTDTVTVIVNNPTLTSPTKKLTPLGPTTTVPGSQTKETKEKKETEKSKFFIHIPFGFGEVLDAPFDFVKANTNFFYGFLFALELIILYFIIKKLRERKKKDKEHQDVDSTPPLTPKRNPLKS